MKAFILYLWQLPQNILGLFIVLVTGAKRKKSLGKKFYFSERYNFGVSLGYYIIFGKYYNFTDILHEYGHQKQSLYLGWLYLLVIGLPSAIHNLINRKTKGDYYSYWCERWADKLGGVQR